MTTTELQPTEIGQTIRMLGDLLGQTIIEQAGNEVFDLEEEIRRLSKAWRNGDVDANGKLGEIMKELASNLPVASEIVKAFSTYFQLINLAEEHQRVAILQAREERAYQADQPMDESIRHALATLKREGLEAADVQSVLNQLRITPVFTAHPTESRRRTIRQILKWVTETVKTVQSPGTLEHEKEKHAQRLRSMLVLLWQSDETRSRRPTVMDEVRNTGLYFFEETLFDVIPEIYSELEKALQAEFPSHEFEIPPFLRYGSWIGGDRDGNPLVTNEVTRMTLCAQKDLVLERYENDVLELYQWLSVSNNRAKISPELQCHVQESLSGVDKEDAVFRFGHEPYRQQLILMFRKLHASRNANEFAFDDQVQVSGYLNAQEFLNDLQLIRNSLVENNGNALVGGSLSKLIRRVEVFGFHLATLDVRQHAGKHRNAVAEVFDKYEITLDYQRLDSANKISLLTKLINSKRPVASKFEFSEETNEILSVFQLMAQAHERIGHESMQTYIISMTECVSNMLEVLLMLQDADLFGKVDIVPLFETVNDLKHAPTTLNKLFSNDAYKRHLAMRNNCQQIMIGYSDSNKDGGYLQANWKLFTAQRQMAATCKDRNVELTLFHGRGGSLGRGGGPANRAILAQPPESVNGRIRVTEQGEVVSSRYSNPAIARRHLQQLVHAVVCSTGNRPEYDKLDRWSAIMDEISELAHRKYRALVDHEKFIKYFQTATPIELVETLNIGSRPSRRKSSNSIEDLRAIPWVFSWTQSRANISSWYGIGTAMTKWCESASGDIEEVQQMYEQWPFFNTLFKNVHLGLGRSDMDIAGLYSQLAEDSVSSEMYSSIKNEFELTCQQVLQVTQDQKILDTESWLQHSITVRNPYVDPLNYIQVALLERLRGGQSVDDSDYDELIRILSNSVNGIAAGLQNVG